MTATTNEFEEATLSIAAMRGWLTGILTGVGILAIFTFGALILEAAGAPGALPWLIVIGLPNLAMLLLLIAIAGGVIAIPSAVLFWVTLLIAERASLRYRTLPVWLAAGFLTAMPATAVVWNLCLTTFTDSDGIVHNPFAWEYIGLPLLTLFCGLVGAFFAWRARQTELAQ